MIVRSCHGGLQLFIALLGSFDLVDQIGPDVVQHLDRTVGLCHIDVELPQDSDHPSHSPDQTFTLAQSALVIWIKQLANVVAKRMAWVL